MERGALSTEEFREFAKGVVPYLNMTSHVEGDKDQGLLSEKGGGGFPYLVAMNGDGKVLAVHQAYPRDVPSFVALMEEAKKNAEKRAAEDLSQEDRVGFLLFDLKVGNVTVDEGRTAAAALEGLDPAKKAEIEDALLAKEISLKMPKSRSPEEFQRAGKAFLTMYEQGRVPKDQRTATNFFYLILEYTYAQGDAAKFETALGKMKALIGNNPRAEGFVKQQESRLAELKAKSAGGD
jgi:hypothetical protein